MNPEKTLSATFWTMIVVAAIGGIDKPPTGKDPNPPHPFAYRRKMPAPRGFVLPVVLWSVLNLVADFSPRAARPVAAMSVVVVLTAMVLGPAGSVLVGLLESVSRVGTGPGAQPASGPAGRPVPGRARYAIPSAVAPPVNPLATSPLNPNPIA